MVSRDKKIPADSIVSSPVIVLPEGHPDIPKFNPNKIIVVPRQSGTANLKSSPYKESLSIDPIIIDAEIPSKDAPDLSDITIHTPLVAKRRKGSNEIYYEIVYKVRNSSATPSNVVGVDARIVGTEPEND